MQVSSHITQVQGSYLCLNNYDIRVDDWRLTAIAKSTLLIVEIKLLRHDIAVL